jgi:DNA polymerase II large subunit
VSIPSVQTSDENKDARILSKENDQKSFFELSENFHYHFILQDEVGKAYEVAESARKLGLDPIKQVEIYRAEDVASRTEGLVGPLGVADRLREMEFKEKLPKDKIVFQIAEEIAKRKFSSLADKTDIEVAEQALRTALSVQTEGITAAPIEGIGRVTIKENSDGSSFLAVYYSGPIRSAGGTAQGISVLIADHIRKTLDLDRYKATEVEVERMLEETRAYNSIMHLQLPTTDEELRYAWRNLPIMIHGDPTEKDEVSGYRNILSMETNKIRGGACLVLNDGVVGRSLKLFKRVENLGLQGYNWLKEIADGEFSKYKTSDNEKLNKSDNKKNKKVTISKRYAVSGDQKFLSDAIAGRPIFSGPTLPGGFRLRYGHARNTGIAGIGLHPAIFGCVDDFLATGTHVRTERPGKGSIVTPIDSIRCPIVLLQSGDVLEVTTYEQAKVLYPEIKKILFMGDMLVGYGEFIQNNYSLVPSGYNVEWWYQEVLKAKGKEVPLNDPTWIKILEELYYNKPDFKEVLEITNTLNVPLHPKFVPAWKFLTVEEVLKLRDVITEGTDILSKEVKPILEKALITHKIGPNGIKIDDFVSLKVQLNLSKNIDYSNLEKYEDGLDFVQELSSVKIKDTMGTTIGARMGRPEKAKARRLSPARHGLFPITEAKAINNDLRKAAEIKVIKLQLSHRKCDECKKDTYHPRCPICNNETRLIGHCTRKNCKAEMDEGPCDKCGGKVSYGKYYDFDVFQEINRVRAIVGEVPLSVKLIPTLKNPEFKPEMLEKAVLRARYDLHVFRDGTIRYDATDAPLTHFIPEEIGMTVHKAKELGYQYDIFGDQLISGDQILALFPQDIIVNNSAKKHFIDTSKFVDDLLQTVYKLNPYYKISSAEDLIGHLIIGLAPHTSAGVIGRLIGFTDATVCWAHPFWHSSKRRNCDGDEDGIILLMDGLLNFSKEYLPTTRGSKMDAPLVLVTRLNPLEVDDEAFNLDSSFIYPLEFYEGALRGDAPKDYTKTITRIENFLGTMSQFGSIPYTHPTKRIYQGAPISKYKEIPSMKEKLDAQMHIAEIISAVDERFVAEQVFKKHFLPDLIGNLRSFAIQGVYCGNCKTKYRRIPLSGKCTNSTCTDKSKIRQNIFPASVSKYLEYSQELIQEYNLPHYMQDRLDRIKEGIFGLFPKQENKQLDLTDFLG